MKMPLKTLLYLGVSLVCIIEHFTVSGDPSTVVDWSFGSIEPFNKSVEFGLNFYAPSSPGKYPVIIFLTGLDGLAISQLYIDFSRQLVDQSKTIVIEFDGLKMLHTPVKEEKLFEKTLNWTIDNMDGLFTNEKTPDVIRNLVFPDLKTWGVTLMGHSAGCHPTVAYLNGTCGIVKS